MLAAYLRRQLDAASLLRDPFLAHRLVANVYPVLAAVLGAWLMYVGFEHYTFTIHDPPSDCQLYYKGAKLILAGKNPYTPESVAEVGMAMGLPPTNFIWFFPLASLDLTSAREVWNSFTIIGLLLMVAIIVRELRLPSPWATTTLGFGAVMAASWMTDDHLSVGQFSVLIALLLVLAWTYLRRGKDVRAGIMLGLALTVKFYPGIIILYLLLCRRVRLAVAAAVTWGVFAIYITTKVGIFGWQAFSEQTQPYLRAWLAHIRNGSLQGVIYRLKYPLCDFQAGSHPIWKTGSTIASILSLALIASTWWLCRKEAAKSDTVDVPFALFTCVAIITGPYTWEHYAVTLVLPIFVTLLGLFVAFRRGLHGAWALAGLAVVGVVVAMLGVDEKIKGFVWEAYPSNHALHATLHFYDAVSWLPAPLLIVVLVLLVRSRRVIVLAVVPPDDADGPETLAAPHG